MGAELNHAQDSGAVRVPGADNELSGHAHGRHMNPTFRYFVNMLPHPDSRIKQANIQILWEVIKEGGHLLLDLVKPVSASGLGKLVVISLAMCKICESEDFEEMTEVILNIFDHHEGVIKFLKASIKRKVAGKDQESMALRGNSFTTGLLTIFTRAQGYDYLRTTLSNLLTLKMLAQST
ncbi:hypothetical protein PCASD_12774 [Puccinia coronata f. sp. avenae]|uniref:Ras-GAP domain-containing protein n=1 Tax=Puccinia coronata f. sp. avenae TaxID=200324 RepID=A0A2N5SZA9_9BASI|nr:hypothetical protein PCASD_12774 [Puccinia coronata f. sp. avenae]